MPTQTFFNLSQDKQRLILEAAVEEFARHDYTNASVSRIVAQVGIAKGSIYQYFQDKQDLYLYVLEQGMQQKFAFLRQRMGFFPYLRWLMEVNFEFELAQPHLNRFLRQATYGELPFAAESLEASRATSLKYIWQLVRQGCAQGELDVNTRLGAFIIHALLGHLGDYVCDRLGLDPMLMTIDQVQKMDRSAAYKIFDEVVGVLERGMAPQKTDLAEGLPHQPMTVMDADLESAFEQPGIDESAEGQRTWTESDEQDSDPESELGSIE
ncbi:MAG: TetR/AcrR family transcriptional regulator [Cyanobacteriota bacterium]|nr:TetR/AcrR family transcriptional regulator [Cyanobacteriota bacterium]